MNERIIDIIEDHESLVQCIDHICCSIQNGMEMPNYVPMLHDSLLSDQLCRIIEKLKEVCVCQGVS